MKKLLITLAVSLLVLPIGAVAKTQNSLAFPTRRGTGWSARCVTSW